MEPICWHLPHQHSYADPYQCCLLFLTYLQGPHVNEWVQSQHQWLVNEVTTNRVALMNVWLWMTMEHAFHQNFVDTLKQEHAQAALKQGFWMKGEDMDDYVAKFECLAQHAGYDLNNIQTLCYVSFRFGIESCCSVCHSHLRVAA